MQREELVPVAVDEQDRTLAVRTHDIDRAHLIAVQIENEVRKEHDPRREPSWDAGDLLEVLADDGAGVRIRGVGDDSSDIRVEQECLQHRPRAHGDADEGDPVLANSESGHVLDRGGDVATFLIDKREPIPVALSVAAEIEEQHVITVCDEEVSDLLGGPVLTRDAVAVLAVYDDRSPTALGSEVPASQGEAVPRLEGHVVVPRSDDERRASDVVADGMRETLRNDVSER